MWPLQDHDVNPSGGKIGEPIDHVDSQANLGTPPEQIEKAEVNGWGALLCQQEFAINPIINDEAQATGPDTALASAPSYQIRAYG